MSLVLESRSGLPRCQWGFPAGKGGCRSALEQEDVAPASQSFPGASMLPKVSTMFSRAHEARRIDTAHREASRVHGDPGIRGGLASLDASMP